MEFWNPEQDNDNVSNFSVSPSDEDEPIRESIPTTTTDAPKYSSVSKRGLILCGINLHVNFQKITARN